MPLIHDFLSLPEELILKCLGKLDWRDLLRCKQVCTYLSNVIESSVEMRYVIELGADGLVDGRFCTLSIAERIQLLLERRARWRHLNWSRVASISVPGHCQAYELVDGLLAVSGNPEHQFSALRRIELATIPTSTEDAIQFGMDLGVGIRDFAIDPSQDLIALVAEGTNLTIHLRTISDNKPHPMARTSNLTVEAPRVGELLIHIVDDIIGAFFSVHGPSLVIWNWRTGRILVRCNESELPMGTFDFSFISNRAYIITVTARCGSIHVYTFDDSEDATISQSTTPIRVAVFHMPLTKPGQGLRRFLTHSGPFVTRQSNRVSQTPDSRMHVMYLQYELLQSYHMFLHNRFLLAHVPRSLNGEAKVVEKKWDEWGPDNTRFMEWMAHFRWLRYTHGERIIFPPLSMRNGQHLFHPFPSPNGQHLDMLMVMFDFRVHPKRLNDPVQPMLPPDVSYELKTKETSTESKRLFQKPVVSRLPYAVICRKNNIRALEDYTGFLIGQDHLVGVRQSTSIAKVDLDVYTF